MREWTSSDCRATKYDIFPRSYYSLPPPPVLSLYPTNPVHRIFSQQVVLVGLKGNRSTFTARSTGGRHLKLPCLNYLAYEVSPPTEPHIPPGRIPQHHPIFPVLLSPGTCFKPRWEWPGIHSPWGALIPCAPAVLTLTGRRRETWSKHEITTMFCKQDSC